MYLTYNFRGINGDLHIKRNNEIEFPSFINLDSINGNLLISDNINVTKINIASNLNFIGTGYRLSDNSLLNDSLLNLTVQSINGSIEIRNNNNLKTIEGFNFHNEINFIRIYLNKDLIEINGLNNFQGFLHTIDISNNNNLEKCNILNETK